MDDKCIDGEFHCNCYAEGDGLCCGCGKRNLKLWTINNVCEKHERPDPDCRTCNDWD